MAKRRKMRRRLLTPNGLLVFFLAATVAVGVALVMLGAYRAGLNG